MRSELARAEEKLLTANGRMEDARRAANEHRTAFGQACADLSSAGPTEACVAKYKHESAIDNFKQTQLELLKATEVQAAAQLDVVRLREAVAKVASALE
jgi:hypothetical protein